MSNFIYIDILRNLYNRLLNMDCDWAIGGNFASYLKGAPVSLYDPTINIQTDKDGAYKIERAFSEFVISPVSFLSSQTVQGYFGVLMIDNVRIEIMGDIQKRLPDGTWEGPADIARYKEYIEVEDMMIPILDPSYKYMA